MNIREKIELADMVLSVALPFIRVAAIAVLTVWIVSRLV